MLLLFPIRAEREDLCFELERLLLDSLGDAVSVVDEVQEAVSRWREFAAEAAVPEAVARHVEEALPRW